MIDDLRPYSEMKPTGLPWLGDVPAHWDVRRSKYVFKEVDKRSTTGEELHLSMSQRHGLVPAGQITRSLVSESYVGGKLVERDDLVLNRLKAHLGVFAYAKQSGLISPDYTVLRPQGGAEVQFFEAVLKSPACRGELFTRAKGIVEGFWRLYTDDFYNIRVPVPPLEEQRLIVRFLDWHGGQVARLVRAKKALIGLLNEQKQAIIHRAVTLGLEPNVPLQSTSLPSFGKVPAHWIVTRMKNVLQEKSIKGFPEEPLLAATQSKGVIRKDDYEKRTVVALKDFHLLKLVEVNDFVISLRSFEGGIEYARHRGIISSAYTVLGCRDPEFHPYLAILLKSPPLLDILKLSVTGIREGQNINYEKLSCSGIALPPVGEALKIACWIGENLSELNKIQGAVENEIALIQEFRTRMIADVVTGKLDVRALAASLPETASQEMIDDPTEDEDLDDLPGDSDTEEAAA